MGAAFNRNENEGKRFVFFAFVGGFWRGRDCSRGSILLAWSIFRRAESSARTRFEKHALFSRLECWPVVCFVWIGWISNRSGSRLEILGFGRQEGWSGVD